MMSVALRIFKHGSSSYTEISAFSSLRVSRVRNDAGSLEFTVDATSVEMLHDWINAAATVELWVDEARYSIYSVDEYRTKWSAHSVQITCSGVLAAMKSCSYTGTFTDTTTLGDVMTALATAAGLDVGTISGATETVGAVSYSDVQAFQVLSDLCTRYGYDFWADGDGAFCAGPTPTTVSRTYELGLDAFEFETSYNARDIVNRVIVQCDGRTWTIDDGDSQTAYGIRALKTNVTGVVSYDAAAAYAAAVFAQSAHPLQQITLIVPHDFTLTPGEVLAVTGVETGVTYQQNVMQIDWTLGDRDDIVQLGIPPLTIDPPTGTPSLQLDGAPRFRRRGGADPAPGDVLVVDDDGSAVWDPSVAAGGVTRGVLTAFDSGTMTATFQPDGSTSTWTVAVPEHISSPTLGRTCWVAGYGG